MAMGMSPGPIGAPPPGAMPPPLPPQALMQPPVQPSAPEDDPRFLSLSKLRTQLQDYDTIKRNERAEAEEARRYYHGDQWTTDQVRTLDDRGQPVVTFNRTKRKIDGIIGLVERLRQDPKGYPRTPQHQSGADVATAVLNEVLDLNQWKSLSPAIARDGALEPVAGVELSLERGDHGDPDIGLHYLEPDTIFYDPRASREDFSDARYVGVAKWVAVDVAAEMFPDRADELKDAATSGAGFDALMDTDRQRQIGWANATAKQVRLVEHWYKVGTEWFWQFYSGDLDLARGVTPFRDEKGRGLCRFILFSANVDHDNDRYGFVRDLKGPQDEVNHRRSKGLHALNSIRLYIDDMGLSDEDIERIRAEIVRPDGVVKRPAGSTIEERSNAEQVAGNLQMLGEAKQEIDAFGPNPSLIGSAPASASGRALQLLQQAGIAELGPYIINYRDWKIRVYRAVWNTVRRHWTAERYIRVTDDAGLTQFLQVNALGFDPRTGQPTIDYALGSLDVDIILDEGPDHVSLAEDYLEALMQLAPSLAQAGKPLPPQIIIEMMNLPQALKNKLLGYLQQANQPDPAKQQATQLQLQGAAAKVDETQARAEKLRADARESVADGARANADAAETMARTRRTHAQAHSTEVGTVLDALGAAQPQAFVPPPYGPAETPFAQGMPDVPGLPPAMMPPPAMPYPAFRP